MQLITEQPPSVMVHDCNSAMSRRMSELASASTVITERLIGVDQFIESITISLGARRQSGELRPYFMAKFHTSENDAHHIQHYVLNRQDVTYYTVDDPFPHDLFVKLVCDQVLEMLKRLRAQHVRTVRELNDIIERVEQSAHVPA